MRFNFSILSSFILIGLLSFGLLACKKKEGNTEGGEASNSEASAQNKSMPAKRDTGKYGYPPYPYDSAKIAHTKSGLGYIILQKGEGNLPKKGETVTANYHGMLTNGKVFDSSFDRGKPFEFQLGMGRVIKGWDEGFQLLPVGSKAILFIPSSLGYGEAGAGAMIPPNAKLIFHVEVLDSHLEAQQQQQFGGPRGGGQRGF